VKTVPRIKKSFAWLYFVLQGLLEEAAGGGEAGAVGGAFAGSCCRATAGTNGAKSIAMHGTALHRGQFNYFPLLV
jgi:hypothetical protein